MSTVIERLTELQDKVVESVTSFQEPVVETVRKAVDTVDERIPELPTDAITEKLPTARELVDNQFEFASRMLKVSHDFVLAILEAIEPVTEKVVKPASPAGTDETASEKAAA
ncbi:hypothetical protein [Rhabdothermincola sediminis]|uniref:hypothetical protein n=1 Tax=Rhabdothermincola sediminis TaxID=2751370 RepID=UPI001AA06908|nr:hypothetical protein [Rhabdothermincola sediminis]